MHTSWGVWATCSQPRPCALPPPPNPAERPGSPLHQCHPLPQQSSRVAKQAGHAARRQTWRRCTTTLDATMTSRRERGPGLGQPTDPAAWKGKNRHDVPACGAVHGKGPHDLAPHPTSAHPSKGSRVPPSLTRIMLAPCTSCRAVSVSLQPCRRARWSNAAPHLPRRSFPEIKALCCTCCSG